MTRLEYKITDIEVRQSETALNKLGQEGWEAFGFSEVSSSTIRVAMKRAISSNQEFLAGI